MLLQDVNPALEQGIPLVPQIIGKDPVQLRTLLKAFKDLGYACADLNAGCPWPFIIKKSRGAGLMRDERLFAAEQEARNHGCQVMLISSYSFQAPGFYQKFGYELAWELNDCPPGFQQCFLVKHFPATEAA